MSKRLQNSTVTVFLRNIRRSGLFLVVTMAMISALPGRAAQPLAPGLLAELPAGVMAPPADALAAADTLSARAVAVDLSALAADALDLDVEPGVTLRAEIDRRSVNPDGSESWSGHIVDSPWSAATFVRAGAVLQGSVRTLDAAYSIEPIANTPFHVVRQVDPSALGLELPPLVANLPPQLADDTPPAPADDGATFDVLVVYTAAARTAAGGSDAAVLARINLGITETNTAYANSGVIPRLRLVGAEAIDYIESGNLSTDLSALTGSGDGQLDAVHARRNALGADLVKLVVGNTAGNACGVAWLMQSLSSGMAAYAFSVTAYPCISPNYTFGHELGHNMGSNHAPEDGVESSPLYPYSFGYKNPGNLFRTVMAYNCPVNCTRILHFSNPSVSYNSQSTGTAAQHNNALSINNARSTIANWRQAVAANTPPTITALGNQNINEDGATPALAFTVGDAQTPAASLSVSATSSNPALVPNTGAALAPGGSGASRTLTVTPLANQSGTTTITVSVSDGSLSASRSFELTVAPVNDAPTLSGVPVLVSTTTGVATSFTVTVNDIDSPAGSLALSGATTNAVLLQPGGILATSQSSTATSRTFLVTLTPAPGQTGSGGLIVTGSDSSATTSAPVSFNVTSVAAAPDPPTATTANASGTSVTIAWAAALTGGAPSSFVVEIGTAPGTTTLPTQSAPSTATQLVLSLPAGTYYTRVRATNAVGSSLPSPEASVTVTDPGPLPGPPGTFSARTVGRTIVFTWTPPVVGEPPTRYVLEAGSAPGLSNLAVLDTGGIASSFSVPNVPSGTYWVRVRAANAAGMGAPSQDVSIVMGPASGCVGLPGVPVLLTPVVSGNNVTLSWNAPSPGGSPTTYVLQAGSGPGLSNLAAFATGSASTSFAASAPGGVYFVRVAASNACGVGPASNEVSFTLGSALPGAPQDLSWSVSSSGVVSLHWEPPASGGVPTAYLVEAGSASGLANLASLSTGSPVTSTDATAPPGAYFVRVRAVNGAGASAASNEVMVVVP